MTWYPISFFPPQFEDSSGNPYSGAVLKAYDAGTTTPVSMATDYTGATTAASFALNASGYPTSGGSIIIPHVQTNIKLALYPTQAAADADSGAVWTYDNIQIATIAEDSDIASINDGQIAGFRNAIINGAFDIWQRNTTFTPGAGTTTYTADRWASKRASTGYTISRQTGPDATQYCARVQRDSADSATDIIYISQSLETANSLRFRGKKVTLRFKARKGANFSSASDILNVRVSIGTGTDQNILAPYTGAANVVTGTATLTTSWQTFSYTSSSQITASATEIGVMFYFTPVGTAGAADYFEISEVELVEGEVGSTYFERLNIGTVLNQCLRYYEKSFQLATVPAQNIGTNTGEYVFIAGKAGATTSGIHVRFGVKKRGASTITLFNPNATNAQVRDQTAAADCSSSTTGGVSENGFNLSCTGNASTAVGNFLAAHWTASAEL